MKSGERRTVLIGLGNPGGGYAGTYHNVGREFLDFLQGKLNEKHGEAPPEEKGKDFHFRKYPGLWLIYPDLYMNLSGLAVEGALSWLGKDPGQAVIFHDDSDLAIGEYKEADGGYAGHHGIESIFQTIKDPEALLRIRIGIRAPLEKSGAKPRRKAGEFVLKKMSARDKKILEREVFEKLAERFLG